LRSAFFRFSSSIRFLKNEYILSFATMFLIFNKKIFTYDGILQVQAQTICRNMVF
jgi:hypothetical protein